MLNSKTEEIGKNKQLLRKNPKYFSERFTVHFPYVLNHNNILETVGTRRQFLSHPSINTDNFVLKISYNFQISFKYTISKP